MINKTYYFIDNILALAGIFFLLCLPMGLGCSSFQKPLTLADRLTQSPQNVLLITIDTLRADHLGCYGYPEIYTTEPGTPAIDALARQGLRFEWAFTPVPITLPSHATIMTGLYPCTHGVLNNDAYRLSESTLTLAQLLHQQGFNTAAFVGAFVLNRQFGLDRGFEVYDDDLAPKQVDSSVEEYSQEDSPEPFALYNERRGEKVTEACLQWLKKKPDRFFIWVHYFDPHTSYDPPQPFKDEYPDRPYDGEIAYTDHCIGLLLKELAAGQLLEETLVVLVADHGESLGEHKENTHGIFLYDATTRVPLILRYPGLPAARVCSQPVKTLDILPTILELLQIPQPAGLQGKSLLTYPDQVDQPGQFGQPGSSDPIQVTDDSIFMESRFPELNFGWSRLEGVRTRQWKYISAPRPELYDLFADPRELHNVMDQYPEQAQRLKKNLQAFLDTSPQPQGNQMLEVDEVTRKRLQKLGYIQTIRTARPDDGPVTSSESSALGLDPKDMIETLPLFDQGGEEYSAGEYQAAIDSFRQVVQQAMAFT